MVDLVKYFEAKTRWVAGANDIVEQINTKKGFFEKALEFWANKIEHAGSISGLVTILTLGYDIFSVKSDELKIVLSNAKFKHALSVKVKKLSDAFIHARKKFDALMAEYDSHRSVPRSGVQEEACHKKLKEELYGILDSLTYEPSYHLRVLEGYLRYMAPAGKSGFKCLRELPAFIESVKKHTTS